MESRKSTVEVEGQDVTCEITGDLGLFETLIEHKAGRVVHRKVSAMAIPGRGCVVHMEKRIGQSMSECAVFVPNVTVHQFEGPDEDGNKTTYRCLKGV